MRNALSIGRRRSGWSLVVLCSWLENPRSCPFGISIRRSDGGYLDPFIYSSHFFIQNCINSLTRYIPWTSFLNTPSVLIDNLSGRYYLQAATSWLYYRYVPQRFGVQQYGQVCYLSDNIVILRINIASMSNEPRTVVHKPFNSRYL